MTWFLAVRIDRSAGRARWFGGGGAYIRKTREIEKVVGEVRGGFVVEEEMRDRVRERGENETTDFL
jgi:hypothetical protein